MTARTTTILGQTFAGRPMMNSLACAVWFLEQEGKIAEAEALLRAYRMLGQGDLSGDFTDLPMEGVEITPAVRKPERIEQKSLGGGWNRWAA